MTTPAGIAPSTNSFSISSGDRGRFSASGSTSDGTAGVLTTSEDGDSSSSGDSGSSEGSAFHSVLHQVYSSHESSQGDDGGETTSDAASGGGTSGGGKSTDGSGSSVAMPVLPVIHDGTQFRNTFSILRTLTSSLTSSTSGATVQTVGSKNDGPSNITASAAGEQVPTPTSTPTSTTTPAPTSTSTFIPTPAWTQDTTLAAAPKDNQTEDTKTVQDSPSAAPTPPVPASRKNSNTSTAILAMPLAQDGTQVRDTSSFLRNPTNSTSGTAVQTVADTGQESSDATQSATRQPVARQSARTNISKSSISTSNPVSSGDPTRALPPKETASSDAALEGPQKDGQPRDKQADQDSHPATPASPPESLPESLKNTSPSAPSAPADAKTSPVQGDAVPVAAKDIPQVLPRETVKPETAAVASNRPSGDRPVLPRSQSTSDATTAAPSIRTDESVSPTKPVQELVKVERVDASATQNPATPITSTPITSTPVTATPITSGESSFVDVLSQIYSSQTEATQPGPGEDSVDIRQSQDQPEANSVSLPPRVAKTRGIGVTISASQISPNDAAPAPETTNSANGTVAPMEPVATAVLASFNGAKPSDANAPARVNVPLPTVDASTTSTAPAPSGELAFAARLTPVVNSSETTSAVDGTDSKSRTAQVAEKPAGESYQASTQASTDATPPERGHTAPAAEPLVKADVNLSTPQPVGPANPPAAATRNEAPPAPPNPSPAARMEQVTEAPAPPQTSSRDITVRLPDATERGTDVRFLERGGEVHVSVRTSDPEMAQTLRGGLGDFVGRMEHTGMRAEVWKPGQDATPSQSDSQHRSFEQEPKGDSRGSGSGKNQQGSQERENSRQQAEKPGWVEELETSLSQPAIQ